MSYLACHTNCDRTFSFQGHLRGPVTFTTVVKRLHGFVTTSLTTWVCRGQDSNTQPSTYEENALPSTTSQQLRGIVDFAPNTNILLHNPMRYSRIISKLQRVK